MFLKKLLSIKLMNFSAKKFKPISKIVAETLTEKISDVAKTEYNLTKKQVEKITKNVEVEAEKVFAEEITPEKVENFVAEVEKNFVEEQEIKREEVKKNSVESDVRAHLRGFARTIPSFIMAYADKMQKPLTLKNFETLPSEKTFLEVTSITKAEFKILREENFFDEIIFNDAIAEFIKRRRHF